MEFIIGCNYWASNAGADTWRAFNLNTVKKDLDLLSNHGIKYLRVFPTWRDFQPIMPIYGGRGTLIRYMLDGEKEPTNPYYLDDKMMDHFSLFLDECEKREIKVMVGLITGWMSGRLYIPSALFDKNLLTDSTAIYFEQLFVKGFVSQFKQRKCIFAWDIGNECGVLGSVQNRYEASSWTATITNAIKAEDCSKPIISGIHSLSTDGDWAINDQALYSDFLVSHPYPYWSKHTRADKTLSYQTTLFPTAHAKYYAEIGEKPCLVEEIGTMGPSVCDDDLAGDFFKINALSLYANGALGIMWWCAFDQTRLTNYPYQREMVERELGMINEDHKAKPVLKVVSEISDFIEKVGVIPPAKTDAICLISKEQNQWGVAYTTYGLMRKIGLNCSNADRYLLPSICHAHITDKRFLDALLDKVSNGATLYISSDNGILSGFEKITGLKIVDSYDRNENHVFNLCGKDISYNKKTCLLLEPTTAKILCKDESYNPVLSVNQYGKGKIYYLNFPLENNLIDVKGAFDSGFTDVYRTMFSDLLAKSIVKFSDPEIVFTIHVENEKIIVIALNHSDKTYPVQFAIHEDYRLDNFIYGNKNGIKPFDALVFSIIKK